LINVIAFQLSFIWTCAELLDLANDNWTEEDDPTDGNFSR
jgi:hypothetical protein